MLNSLRFSVPKQRMGHFDLVGVSRVEKSIFSFFFMVGDQTKLIIISYN
jgi:hypothetical protein